jgi:replication factor C small subunit
MKHNMETTGSFWKDTFLSKYKPSSIDQLIGNEHIVETLNTYLHSNQLTNIIFTGDTGIGKSTCCDLLVKQYLGEKFSKCGRLNVYGTLNRSKDIVIENSEAKANKQCTMNVTHFIRRYDEMEDKKKVVIFHDLEAMKNTQLVLRRMMEEYNDVYYIILCEDLSGVIEAIQSRCVLLHFNNPSTKELYKYALKIWTNENLQNQISKDMLKNICIVSGQNVRKLLMYIWMLKYVKTNNETQFQTLFGVTSTKLITSIIMYMYKRDVKSSLRITKYMIDEGFNLEDILHAFIKTLDFCKVSSEFKKLLIEKIAICIVNNAKYQTIRNLYCLITDMCV